MIEEQSKEGEHESSQKQNESVELQEIPEGMVPLFSDCFNETSLDATNIIIDDTGKQFI